MNRRDWMIGVPVLGALAGCLVAFLHGMQIQSSVDGMAALRSLETPAGARVAVVAARALHLLDADGRRLARQDLGAIGLQDNPNDMDLTLDAAGQLEAWFFDDARPLPRVIRCTWNEASAAFQPCLVVASGAQLKWDATSRAVHLAVDRAGERMFVADARSARVQTFSLDGKRLSSSAPSELPLNFPNRLRYLGNDELVIADNDHRRLLWAKARPGAPVQLVSTLYAADHPHARGNRTKVTDVAFGRSGGIWMLAVKQGQKDGDVLVFDAARRPVARAGLPAGADPLFIEALGDAAVVADFSLLALHRLDPQGRYLGEFGDAAFKAELTPLRERLRRSKMWTNGGMGAGAVVLLLGFLLAWRFGSKAND